MERRKGEGVEGEGLRGDGEWRRVRGDMKQKIRRSDDWNNLDRILASEMRCFCAIYWMIF